MIQTEKHITDFEEEVRLLRREVDELRGAIEMMRSALLTAGGATFSNAQPFGQFTTRVWPQVTTVLSQATRWGAK